MGTALVVDSGEERSTIHNICVVPKYRGKGYGTQIIEEIVKKVCQNKRIKQVGLIVDQSNPRAKKLYESLGFKGRIWTRDGSGEASLAMWKSCEVSA